jgi:hypothetical protein
MASNPRTLSADRMRAGTGVPLSTAIASTPPAANCHDRVMIEKNARRRSVSVSAASAT